ncbi:hypothetical protein FRC10_005007, partial [Ceratobasidium sp. 414]
FPDDAANYPDFSNNTPQFSNPVDTGGAVASATSSDNPFAFYSSVPDPFYGMPVIRTSEPVTGAPDPDPRNPLGYLLKGAGLVTTTQEVNKLLSSSRWKYEWENWEKHWMVMWLAGKGVPEARLRDALDSEPRSTTVEPLWDELSTIFRGQRSPTTLRQRFTDQVFIYCGIITAYATSPQEPAANILARIRKNISSDSGVGLSELVKPEDLAAWIEGDNNSWFAILHPRFYNHKVITKRMKALRYTKASSRTDRTRSSWSGNSITRSPLVNTTSPAGASTSTASAPIFGQPSQPSEITQDDAPEANLAAFAPNLPGVLEIVRNMHAVCQAAIALAQAKTEYLNVAADGVRVKTMSRILDMNKEDNKQRCRIALDILESTSSPPLLREDAVRTLNTLLGATNPPMINQGELLRVLREYLPGPKEIVEHVMVETQDPRVKVAVQDLVSEIVSLSRTVAPGSPPGSSAS